MKILTINSSDIGGGAEKVAYDLHCSYKGLGHDVRMLVGNKKKKDNIISQADYYEGANVFPRLFQNIETVLQKLPGFRGKPRIIDWVRKSSLPLRWLDYFFGKEDFNYPYSWKIVKGNWIPDVIHLHNLHGNYFDLRALEIISKTIPIVWTLHDAWAFTGHCAYPLECEKWQLECNKCPDIKRPPPIFRDNTTRNYNLKKQIYQNSRIFVSTPSEWLMSLVKKSILQERENMVIPNGVDLTLFFPTNPKKARKALGLPLNAFICLYISFIGARSNPYKDYHTVYKAVKELESKFDNSSIYFVCIGSKSQSAPSSNHRYTGYISDPGLIASYYQAADVLLHAAEAENFPSVIIESMACGTPVIATSIGGIPEQVEHGKTGFLVSPKDYLGMAKYAKKLLENEEYINTLKKNSIEKVQRNYDLKKQTMNYLCLFENLTKIYSD